MLHAFAARLQPCLKVWRDMKVSLSPADIHLTVCILILGGQFSISGLGYTASQGGVSHPHLDRGAKI